MGYARVINKAGHDVAFCRPDLAEKSWLHGPGDDAKLLRDDLTKAAPVPFLQRDITALACAIPAVGHPTFAGTKSAFTDLTAKVKPGDFVYLHLSGSGAQATALNPEAEQGPSSQPDAGFEEPGMAAEGQFVAYFSAQTHEATAERIRRCMIRRANMRPRPNCLSGMPCPRPTPRLHWIRRWLHFQRHLTCGSSMCLAAKDADSPGAVLAETNRRMDRATNLQKLGNAVGKHPANGLFKIGNAVFGSKHINVVPTPAKEQSPAENLTFLAQGCLDCPREITAKAMLKNLFSIAERGGFSRSTYAPLQVNMPPQDQTCGGMFYNHPMITGFLTSLRRDPRQRI